MSKTKIVQTARENLLSYFKVGSICAEVGTWKGDFASEILESTKPACLHLIDPYKHFGEYKKAWYGGSIGEQKKMDKILLDVKTRFASEIESGQVVINRNASEEGLGSYKDDYFDWIYIDGNHTYDFVCRDLLLAFDKVKSGGYIAGDDYNLVGWWEDGVTKAFMDFICEKKHLVKVVYVEETQFLIEKI